MRRRRNFAFMGLLVMTLVITSCNKEYFQLDKLSDEMEITPNVVVPLIHGSMSMGDIVALFDSAGYVGEFEDGLIYLAYSDTLVNLRVDTLDLVVDDYYDEIYLSPEIGSDPVFISSGLGDTVHFLKSTYYSLDIKGESRLDSIFFKGGQILIEVASTFRHRGVMTISSEYIRDPGGNDYSNSIEITSSAGDFTGSVNHSLDGYLLETIKQGDSSVFRVDYDLALINSGNPINPGESCGINTSMLDLGFYSLFGYVDPAEVVSEGGEQEIGIFSDYPALSHLKLADPRINIFTESSLGIPFELTLDSVIATAEDMSTLALEFYEGHPFKIPAPSLSQVGETIGGEFNINNQTSNFHELLNLAPHSLSYRLTGGIDPDIPDQNHFLLDTSRFMLEAEFLIPLDLKYTQYALEDTLEFEIGGERIDTALVKDVQLKVRTVNELPIELDLQLYLLDESYLVLDSLFEQEGAFLPASVVDGDGLLLSASEQSHTVKFHTEKLIKLEHVRYIVVVARLVTSGQGAQYVKFYSQYTLEFEISLHASLRINTQEL
ncbi:MAG: hypothetical protein E4H10_03035 [Bacteroidia bacterium]|nr:MAG: hypothetical protein E4H10_03035 [Bacteroidia bacterium]